MATVRIPQGREDAIIIVKASLEACDDVKSYCDDGTRVVANTRARLGMLVSSYGEKIIIEIPHDQSSSSETMVSITGKRQVSVNIGADPEKYVSQLLSTINRLKSKDMAVILDILDEMDIDESSKEVTDISNLSGGLGV